MYFIRNKGKYIADVKTPELYEFYKGRVENPLSYAQFSRVIQDVNKNCIYKLALTGQEFRLPAGLGVLYISKRKILPKFDENGKLDIKNLKPDWKKTKELWATKYPDVSAKDLKAIKDKPIIYFMNEHSDRYRMLFNWDKRTCNIMNQSFFAFSVVRTLKSEVAKYFVESGNTDYYEYKVKNYCKRY